MFENVTMFEELTKYVVRESDIITYYDGAYSLAVVSDECSHAVYVYDKDHTKPLWSFVGEFAYSEWKSLYKFLDTLRGIRSPFDINGNLKSYTIPF